MPGTKGRNGAAAKAEAEGRGALRLFAASARNIMPRMIHSLANAAVGWFVVGPAWTLAWFAAAWATTFIGIGLMSRIGKAKGPQEAKRLTSILLGVNIFSGVIQAAFTAGLWVSGDAMAQAFALVGVFISASYVLQQYYADLKSFRIFMAPSGLLLAFIGVDLIRRSHEAPVAMLAVAAAAAALVNFFMLARRQMDASRSALRQARAKAREGEVAAESANAAKSTFLATMSHEIRTPLNGVLGMTQAMSADALSDIQRDRLSIIHQSGEALLAILNDILDLSKIEAGKLELEEIDFDLGDVARGAHSAFTALANKKGLSFCLDIEAARGMYRGDPTRLRQILYNLISNALKFTERGEIRVTAELTDEGLRMVVADTGVGIPAEAMAKLFGKFAQVDASTTRRFGGTGLGLAICQQLAALMGGKIEAESEFGKGARFTVTLPMQRIGEERPAPALPTPDAPVAEAMTLRVLAAEDNTVNQLVLKTLLHQIGVEPFVVEDGVAAVDAWETSEWDAILMDVQMPNMDGPSATRAIRKREAESGRKRTPIIALTANAMSHQVAEYLAAGMDGHVAKPIEALRLFEALQTVIEQQEAEAAREADEAAVA